MRISDWSSDVCSSDLLPGHFQRVEHLGAVVDAAVVVAQAGQLVVEEADVERGVVDHKFRAIDEGEELVGDRGELRLVGEELQGQAGDRKSTRLNSSH